MFMVQKGWLGNWKMRGRINSLDLNRIVKTGSWQVAVGRWRMAGGRWQVADGGWQVAGGSRQFAVLSFGSKLGLFWALLLFI